VLDIKMSSFFRQPVMAQMRTDRWPA